MDLEALYIRNPSDTEARGPFTARQVADLADAGQVTPQTLVFEAGTQQWVTVGSLPDLMTIVLPEKKKLTLKAKEFKPLNQPDVLEKKLDVQDMLNAAEGKTDETASRRDPTEAMSRAAAVGRYGAILGLLLAAAAALFPLRDALLALDSTKVLAQPLACVGFFDLALAVLLALESDGHVPAYPFSGGSRTRARGLHLLRSRIRHGADAHDFRLCRNFLLHHRRTHGPGAVGRRALHRRHGTAGMVSRRGATSA